MGSFNSDIRPTSTGLRLGNENQKWIAYIEDLFVDVVLTNTPNQALTGTFRLASTDTISWRNAANTADVSLSKTVADATTTPADTLVWSGAGIEGPFLSHQLNPAGAGELRLASTDVITFRNNANTGDVAALTHNSDDTVTVGGSAGISSANGTFANLTVTGTLIPGAVTGPNTADLPITVSAVTSGTGKKVTVSGGNSGVTAGDVVIKGGDGTGPVSGGGDAHLQGGAKTGGGIAGSVFIADAGTTASVSIGDAGTSTTPILFYGRLTKYQGVVTANNGIACEVAAVDLTAQTAAITTATLYTLSAAEERYRLSWSAKITTAAGTSSTLGALTIVYTDPDGVAITLTAAAVIAAGTVATTSAANTTGTVLMGIPQYLNCKAGTSITYAFGYASNAAAAMNYNFHILLELC